MSARIDFPRDVLEKMYFEKELSQKEIAKALGVSVNVIRRNFRVHNLTPRRTHTSAARELFSKKRTKFNDEQIRNFGYEYTQSEIPSEVLARKYDCSDSSYLARLAVEKGFITEDERRAAARRRQETPIRTMMIRHEYSEEERQEISKRMTGDGNPFFGGIHSEEARAKMSSSAIKRIKKTGKYFVEGRFYAASLEEGAVALLLEDYILGKKAIKPEVNFQASGDTRCIYDFVLGDKILEWHPINLHRDSRDLGFREDLEALAECKEEAQGKSQMKDYRELVKQFNEDLAVEYWMRRQEASDNSQIYQGKEVELVRNERELYNFLSRYANMPSYSQFRKEFNQAKEEVRRYKVEKKGKAA